MAKKYKYADKNMLHMANAVARDVMKFNRCVDQSVIDALPDDKFFPIIFTLLHEHRAGQPCEPHVRCMFATPLTMGLPTIHGRETILIDVAMNIYDVLPEVELPEEQVEKQDEPAKA